MTLNKIVYYKRKKNIQILQAWYLCCIIVIHNNYAINVLVHIILLN